MITYVYFIKSGGKKSPIKIGVANNIEQRMSELQIGNPTELTLIASIPCFTRKHAYSIENMLHRAFKRHHVRGEWFNYRINLKVINKVFEEAGMEKVKNTDNDFISDAGKITRLRANVKALEKTIKWQEEEIERLLETINNRY